MYSWKRHQITVQLLKCLIKLRAYSYKGGEIRKGRVTLPNCSKKAIRSVQTQPRGTGVRFKVPFHGPIAV